MNIDWPESLVFDTSTMSSLGRDNLLPNQWDRVGNMGGNNFTTLPDNGIPYSYDQRAIPYLENASARHLGTFDNNLYFDSIDAIRSNNLETMNTLLSNNGKDVISQVQFDDMVARYKKYESDLAKYIGDVDAPYGLKGVASSWTDDAGNVLLNGGAEQIVTPLSGSMLEDIGVVTITN